MVVTLNQVLMRAPLARPGCARRMGLEESGVRPLQGLLAALSLLIASLPGIALGQSQDGGLRHGLRLFSSSPLEAGNSRITLYPQSPADDSELVRFAYEAHARFRESGTNITSASGSHTSANTARLEAVRTIPSNATTRFTLHGIAGHEPECGRFRSGGSGDFSASVDDALTEGDTQETLDISCLFPRNGGEGGAGVGFGTNVPLNVYNSSGVGGEVTFHGDGEEAEFQFLVNGTMHDLSASLSTGSTATVVLGPPAGAVGNTVVSLRIEPVREGSTYFSDEAVSAHLDFSYDYTYRLWGRATRFGIQPIDSGLEPSSIGVSVTGATGLAFGGVCEHQADEAPAPPGTNMETIPVDCSFDPIEIPNDAGQIEVAVPTSGRYAPLVGGIAQRANPSSAESISRAIPAGLTANLTIVDDTEPVFAAVTVATVFVVRQTVNWRPPETSGGNGALRTTYPRLMSLPDGLQYVSTNGRLSGTPTEPGTFRYTAVVTDSDSQIDGRSDDSTTLVIDFHVREPGGPGMPTVSALSPTELSVTWVAAATEYGVTGYDVEYWSDTGSTMSLTTSGIGTGATIGDLVVDTPYMVRVRARGESQMSDWSPEASGNTGKIWTVSMDAASVPAAEGATAEVTVTVDSAPDSDLRLEFGLGSDSDEETRDAAVATDLGTIPDGVTLSAGATTAVFSIPVEDDDVSEVAEVVVVTLTGASVVGASPDRATLGMSATTAVTIGASDPIRFSVTGPMTLWEDDATASEYQVTLSGGELEADLDVTIEPGGTASAGADFTLSRTELVFMQGDLVEDFSIDPNDPVFDPESAETIVVGLSVQEGAVYVDPAWQPFTATLHDDDSTTVSFESEDESAYDTVAVEGEEPLLIPLRFQRKGPLSVGRSAISMSRVADPEVGEHEYLIAPIEVDLSEGEHFMTVHALYDGGEAEDDEELVLFFPGERSFFPLLVDDPEDPRVRARLTIRHNGAPPSNMVSLSIDTPSVEESGGETDIVVTASLTGSDTRPPNDVVVDLSLVGGAATAATPIPRLTIAAGSLSGSVTVPVRPDDDNLWTGTRTVELRGSGEIDRNDGQRPEDLVVSGTSFTVIDDDTIGLTVSGPPTPVDEHAGEVVFTLTLSEPTGADLTVTLAVEGGSAEDGRDYVFPAGTAAEVVFPGDAAPRTTRMLNVALTDDMLSEGVETIEVLVSGISPDQMGRVIVTDEDAVAMIAASDPLTAVLSGSGSAHAGAPLTYVLGLTRGQSTAPVTIGFSGSVTPTSGTAVPLSPPALTLQVGTDRETFEIAGLGTMPSDSVRLWITSAASEGGGEVTWDATSTVSIDIREDVVINASFVEDDYEVSEDSVGTTAAVVVTLDVPPTGPISIPITISDTSSATESEDYTLSPESLTFGRDVTARTVTVTAVDDNLDDGDKEVVLGFGTFPTFEYGTLLATGSVASETVTITDDDDPPMKVFSLSLETLAVSEPDSDGAVTYTPSPASTVAETGDGTVPFVLSAELAGTTAYPEDLTVSVTVSGGTAEHAEFQFETGEFQDDGTFASEAVIAGAAKGLSVVVPAGSLAGSLTFGFSAHEGTGGTPDARAEPVDSVVLSGSSVASDSPGFVADGFTFGDSPTFFIEDREGGEVYFVDPTHSFVEGTGGNQVAFQLSPPPGVDVDVPWTATREGETTAAYSGSAPVTPATIDGIGHAVLDLTALDVAGDSVNFTIELGVPVAQDVARPLSKPYVLAQDPAAGQHGTAVARVVDDDVDRVSFERDEYSTPEATGAPATVQVSLSSDLAEDVVITVVATPTGGAVLDSDYSLSTLELAFAAGDTVKDVVVTAIDDDFDDDGEAVELSFDTLPTGVFEGVVNVAEVAITDDDAPAMVGISLSAYSLTVEDVEPVPGSLGEFTAVTQTTAIPGNRVAEIEMSEGPALLVVSATLEGTTLLEEELVVTVTVEDGSGRATDADYAFEVPHATATVGPNGLLGPVNSFGSNLSVEIPIPAGSRAGDVTFYFRPREVEGTPPNAVTLAEPEEPLVFRAGVSPDIAVDESGLRLAITDRVAGHAALTADEFDVTEGTGVTAQVELDVELEYPSAVAVTVPWSVDPAEGLSSFSGSVVISANSTTGTITLTVADDELLEGDVTLDIELMDPTTDQPLSMPFTLVQETDAYSVAAVTVADDDTASLSVTPPEEEVAEPGTARFEVSLDREPGTDITVTLATTDASATGGSDYVTPSGADAEVIFTVGDLADAVRFFDVEVSEDDLSEPPEVFNVSVSGVTPDLGARLTLPESPAPATIAAGDPLVVALAGPSEVDEGEVAIYTLELTGGGSSADVTVGIGVTSDSGAVAGVDYTAPDAAITMAAGTPMTTFGIPVPADLTTDVGEILTVSITSATSEGGGEVTASPTANSVETAIGDNIAANFSVDVRSLSEAGAGTPANVEVSLSVEPDEEVDIRVVVSPLSTAEEGEDFTLSSKTLTFGPGVTSRTVVVTAADDSRDDDNEVLTLEFASLPPGIAAGTQGSVVLVIEDDDEPLEVEIGFSLPGETDFAAEEGFSFDLVARLEAPAAPGVELAPERKVSVPLVLDFGPDAAPGDIDVSPMSFDFPADSGLATVRVSLVDDPAVESRETVVFDFDRGSLPHKVMDATGGPFTLRITDNDLSGRIDLEAEQKELIEGGGPGAFTVTATYEGEQKLESPLVIPLSFSGDAPGDASGGYVIDAATPPLVTIPALLSVGVAKLSIESLDDGLVETDEVVVIGAPIGHSGLQVKTATIVIGDDDAASVSVSAGFETAPEGSAATLTAHVDKPVVAAVTVAWSAGGDAGEFEVSSGEVVIPALSLQETFEVTPAVDGIAEPKEVVGVFFDGADSGDIDLSNPPEVPDPDTPASFTVDDGDILTLGLGGPAAVREARDAEAVYTVSVAGPAVPETDVTVTVSADATDAGHPASPDDIGQPVPAVATILAGPGTALADMTATVSVPIRDDSGIEPDETFVLSVTGAEGVSSFDLLGPQRDGLALTTTIEDDENRGRVVSLALSRDVFNEGEADSIVVTASLGGSVARPEDIEVTIAADLDDENSTASQADFALAEKAGDGSFTPVTELVVTIRAGELFAAGNLRFTAVDDALFEQLRERIALAGSAAGHAVESATLTIVDRTALTLTLSGPAAVPEGEVASYRVDVDSAISLEIAVTVPGSVVSPEESDAVAGTDFGPATPTEIVLSPGAPASGGAPATPATRSESFSVPIREDADFDPAETIVFGLGDVERAVVLTLGEESVSAEASEITTTIEEDDTITVSFDELADNTLEEGLEKQDTITVTVRLSEASGLSLSLPITAVPPGFPGDDYVLSTPRVEFGPDDTMRVFTVSVREDNLVEERETVVLGLVLSGAPGLEAGANPSVTFHVEDDDVVAGAVNLALSRSEIAEGSGGIVTVTARLGGDAVPAQDLAIPVLVDGTESVARKEDFAITVVTAGESKAVSDPFGAFLSVTIEAGTREGAVVLTVAAVEDGVFEHPEEISFAAGGDLGSSNATLTIYDAVRLSLAGPAEVTEGTDAVAGYLVRLVSPLEPGAGVVVTGTVTAPQGSGATEGGDYSQPARPVVTLTAVGEIAAFSVPIVNDTANEAVEEIRFSVVSVSVIGDYLPVSVSELAQRTKIHDDDFLTASFVPLTVSELHESGAPAGKVSVTVTLSAAPALPVTVAIVVSSDSAIASDYSVSAQSLVFAAGQTERSFVVGAVDDNFDDDGESLRIRLGLGATGAVRAGDLTEVSVTIVDDDAPQENVIRLSLSETRLGEGRTGTVTVTASLNTASKTDHVVTVDVGGADSAAGKDDYGLYVNGAEVAGAFDLPIPAGALTGEETLTVSVAEDTVAERGESVLLSGTAAGFTVDGTALTLHDVVTLTLAGPDQPVAEGDEGDGVSVPFILNVTGNRYPVSLTFSVESAGIAMEGEDYTLPAESTVVLKEVGSATDTVSATVLVPVVGDSAYEPHETVLFTVTGASGDYLVAGSQGKIGDFPNVRAEIRDDDSNTASFAALAETGIHESGSPRVSVSVTVSLAAAPGHRVSLPVTVDSEVADASDYVLSPPTLVFEADETEKSFAVVAVDDVADEKDELLTLGLDLSDVARFSQKEGPVVTLFSDDAGASTVINLSLAQGGFRKGVPEDLVVVARREGASAVPADLSIPVSVAADGTTADEDDYRFGAGAAGGDALPLNVTIPAGALEGRATVRFEALASATPRDVIVLDGAAGAFTVNGATLTIFNRDLITLRLSGPGSVDEGAGSANYTVRVDSGGPRPLSDLQVTGSLSVPEGSTAEAGTDFAIPASLVRNIPAAPGGGYNDLTAVFRISINNDGNQEPSESFVFDLASASGDHLVVGFFGDTLGPPGVTTTITDNDPYLLRFGTDFTVAAERGNPVPVAVALNSPLPVAVTIPLTVSSEDASPPDYVLSRTSVVFAPFSLFQGLEVTASDDAFYDDGEVITLGFDLAGLEGFAAGVPPTIRVTLEDDTPLAAQATLSLSSKFVSEGAAQTITITAGLRGIASHATDLEIPVGIRELGTDADSKEYAIVAETLNDAGDGIDVGIFGGDLDLTVTIDAGKQEGKAEFVFEAFEDRVTEAEEEIVFFGSVPAGSPAGFEVADATLTVFADDAVRVWLEGVSEARTATLTVAEVPGFGNLVVPDATDWTDTVALAEGDTFEFALRLSAPVTTTVRVPWGVRGGAGDVTPRSGTVLFGPGDHVQTVALGIVDDALSEMAEEFELTIGIPTRDDPGTPPVGVIAAAAPEEGTYPSLTLAIGASDPLTVSARGPLDSSSPVIENSDAVYTFVVTGGESTEDISISLDLTPEGAEEGMDYADTVAQVVIPAGESKGSFSVRVLPDMDLETEPESVVISFPSVTGGGGGTVTTAASEVTKTVTTHQIPAVVAHSAEYVTVALDPPVTRVSGNATVTQSVTHERTVTTVTVAAATVATVESRVTVLQTVTPTDPLTPPAGGTLHIEDADAPDTNVAFTPGNYTVYEEGETSVQVPVTLGASRTVEKRITVFGSSEEGEAALGIDFAVRPKVLVFAPGTTSLDVTVSAIDDIFDDDNELVTLMFHDPPPDFGITLGPPNEVTVSITDNNEAPSNVIDLALSTLTVDPVPGAEAGARFTPVPAAKIGEITADSAPVLLEVAATLQGRTALTGDLVVTVTVAGGSATAGRDYAFEVPTEEASYDVSSGQFDNTAPFTDNLELLVTIPARRLSGASTIEFYPREVEDAESGLPLAEPEETVVFGGVVGDGDEYSVPDTVQLTIVDRFAGHVAFTEESIEVSEGDAPVVVSVVMNSPAVYEVVVPWTAVPAGELIPVSGDVIFPAGMTSTVIELNVTDDGMIEGTETVGISLGMPATSPALSRPFTVIAEEDETETAFAAADIVIMGDAVDLEFGAGPRTVTEAGETSVMIPVTLGEAQRVGDARITLAFASDRGAEEGADYTVDQTVLVFAAGATSLDVEVAAVDDLFDDDGESVTISFGDPVPPGFVAGDPVTVAITDNDAMPSTTVSLGLVSLSVRQTEDPPFVFTVEFTPMPAERFAEIDVEYDAAALLELAATLEGSTALPDDLTVTVTLAGESTATDSDFSFFVPDPGEEYDAEFLEFGLGEDFASDLTVLVTIPAGTLAGSATIEFTPYEDEDRSDAGELLLAEPAESVVFAGEVAGGVYTVPNSVQLTVEDRFAGHAVLTDNSHSVMEGTDMSVELAVELGRFRGGTRVSYPAAGDVAVTIPWTLMPDTGQLSGVGSVVLTNGATSAIITLNVTDDMVSEFTQDIRLVLGTPTSTPGLSRPYMLTQPTGAGIFSVAVITVEDDDAVTVSFGAAEYEVTEDGGRVEVPVVLGRTFGTPTEISVSVSSDNAEEGIDYSVESTVLTFPAETTSQNVVVTAIDNSFDDEGKVVTLSLFDPPGDIELGMRATAEVEIIDDDADLSSDIALSLSAFSVTITPAAGSGAAVIQSTAIPGLSVTEIEAGDEPVFLVLGATLGGSGVSPDDLVVTVTVGGSGTASGADYTFDVPGPGATEGSDGLLSPVSTFTTDLALPVTIPAGMLAGDTTVYFRPHEAEGASSVTLAERVETLALRARELAEFSVADAGLDLSIVDRIAGHAALTGNDFTVTEGAGTAAEVELDVGLAFPSAVAVTLPWEVTPAGELDSDSGSVVFAPNSTSGVITLTATADSVLEPIETLEVALRDPTTAEPLSMPFTLTQGGSAHSVAAVEVLDSGTAEIAVVAPDDAVAEPGTATFGVSLSEAPGVDVTVTLITSDGTANGGTDFTGRSGTAATVTFTVGDAAGATRPFEVEVRDDAVSEPDETFSVGISGVTPDFGTGISLPTAPTPATIGANDPITVSVTAPSSHPEGTRNLRVGLSLTGGERVGIVSITFDLDGTALSMFSNGDYWGGTGLNIPATESAPTIRLVVINDGIDDDDETIELSGRIVGEDGRPYVFIPDPPEFTITIVDDDDPEVAVAFMEDSYSAGEGGGIASVILTLDADPERDVNVTVVATPQGGAIPGDYSLDTTVASFSAGNRTATVEVTARDDIFHDPGESVRLSIDSASLPARVSAGTPDTETVAITDNDAALGTDIGLSATSTPAALLEGSGTVPVTLTASLAGNTAPATALGLSVSVRTGADTAEHTDVGVVGLEIAAGELSVTRVVNVELADDDAVEADRELVFEGTLGGFTVDPVTLAVADDDTAEVTVFWDFPEGEPEDFGGPGDIGGPGLGGPGFDDGFGGGGPGGGGGFGVEIRGHMEEGEEADLRFVLDAPVDADVSLPWGVELAGPVEVGDFTGAVTGTVEFGGAGSSESSTIAVLLRIEDDDLFEGEETVSVTLGPLRLSDAGLAGDVTLANGGPVEFPVTVSDRSAVGISGTATEHTLDGGVTRSYVEVVEGETATLTLSVSGGAGTEDISVPVATGQHRHGHDAQDADFTALLSPVVIPAGSATATFEVTTRVDSEHDAGEIVAVTIGDPSGGAPGEDAERGTPTYRQVTIIEPNPGAPEYTDTAITVTLEENTASITMVSVTDPDGHAVTYRIFDDPADSDTDPELFTIDAGGTVSVADGSFLDESRPNLTVTIEARDGRDRRGIADEAADTSIVLEVEVTDVDEPPPDLTTVAAAPPPIEMGGHTRVTVSWPPPTDYTGPPIRYEVQYKLEGADDSTYVPFPYDGSDPMVTITGLQPGVRYVVRVRPRNNEDSGAEAEWTVFGQRIETLANAAPVYNAESATLVTEENVATGGAVGAPVPPDVNDEDALTYTLTGDRADAFGVNPADGQVTVAQAAPLDFEALEAGAGPVFSLTLEVEDEFGLTDTIDLDITVTDVDEPPGEPTNLSVDSATSSTRLTLSWDEPANTGPPVAYEFIYRETGEFAYVGAGQDEYDVTHTPGETVATIAGLEPGTGYDVSMRATNGEGDSGLVGVQVRTGSVPTFRVPLANGDPGPGFGHADALVLFYSLRFGNFLRANPRLLTLVYNRLFPSEQRDEAAWIDVVLALEELDDPGVVPIGHPANVYSKDGSGLDHVDALMMFYSIRFGNFLLANPRLLNLVFNRLAAVDLTDEELADLVRGAQDLVNSL